jgi:hypothetical protein
MKHLAAVLASLLAAFCADSANPHMFGVPWIRGTFLSLSDLPPRKPDAAVRQSGRVAPRLGVESQSKSTTKSIPGESE